MEWMIVRLIPQDKWNKETVQQEKEGTFNRGSAMDPDKDNSSFIK